MEDGKAWEVSKGRIDDVVIIAHPADTGIGVEACEYGVDIGFYLDRDCRD